ncbi:tyrosine-type recombinase/integrase [Vibrio vulnificus]|nr:tyrosine-type recombinase/integrase [Vibrio vulnificus]
MILPSEKGFFTTHDPNRFFKLERDAKGYEVTLSLRHDEAFPNKDYRRLDEVITLWYKLHGKTLRDHIRVRKLLYRISDKLSNPVASELTNEHFARYRESRIQEVTTTTANREHSYLRAMFNELKRLGVIDYDNPVANIRQFREREKELRFLSHDEIEHLLDVCDSSSNKSLIHIVKVCLATGSRWGEAESLKASQVINNKITFIDTKSRKNRTIPIADNLFNELLELEKVGDERLFLSSLSAFRKAIEKSQIKLPRGQMSHVLRHTFASHFVMQGGNIIVLRDILGHSEITTTMRYAHLAPNHLADAIKLNPLNQHQ